MYNLAPFTNTVSFALGHGWLILPWCWWNLLTLSISQSDHSNWAMLQVKNGCPRPGWDERLTQENSTHRKCKKLDNIIYVNIGETLSWCIANVDKPPTEHIGEGLSQTSFLKTVVAQEVDEIINNLTDGAPGSDGIKSLILKITRQNIVSPPCYLCDIYFTEGVFPDEIKFVNVLPLFKTGDPLLFKTFRPVCLLCVLSKVFEKVMYSRLLSFLE